MTTKLTPQTKKVIRKVTEALKDSMISITIDDLVNATGSSPTVIKNTLAKIEGVKQDENGYYLPRDDHELNAVAVNTQDDGANIQDKELNTQAPHVSYHDNESSYPDIEFEQPTKELKGSDLCRAMLDKGWVSVPCYISDESDYEADNNAFCVLIGKFDKCFKELATNYEHEYAVPFDPRTGEPLTEAVLDE